jgi:deoxyribodipyrimidine photo-lyase
MLQPVNVFWFRRDLRLQDNTGLFHALHSGLPVLPVFIFDRNILDELEDRADRRAGFIYHALETMKTELENLGYTLHAVYDTPLKAFEKLTEQYAVNAVFANHDYEPYATQRDEAIRKELFPKNIPFHTFKDQVIFEKSEVVKNDGTPYSVFTPYAKRWMATLKEEDLKSFNTPKVFRNFLQVNAGPFPSLKAMGFTSPTEFPETELSKELISRYHQTRDLPAIKGTTRVGVHLRFGTVSIRQLAARALEWNQNFLNELIWREFFMHLLWHFPRLVNESCKKEYEGIQWRNNEKEFGRWCKGETGYPIVDAGMRELNETGFMHNRVRMITASFLVKHLLIDWRWGEAYFAKKLLDYELSSNNGNWQWVAGCGCDAAPYFRIFSPEAQTKKFDPQLEYVRKWVPELESFSYPKPVVEQQFARERCLKAYKTALNTARQIS